MMDSWIKLMLVVFRNALWFLGDQIMNGMVEPVLTKVMWYYQIPITLGTFVKGQDAKADFVVDMRHTQMPRVGDGELDMYFVGDWMYDNQRCSTPIVDNNLHFYNS